MTQFDSMDIFVDGYDLSQRLGFNSYTIKNSSDRLFGINRSIEVEDSLNGEVYLAKFNNTRPVLDVEIARVDNWGNPIPIKNKDLDELGRILFTNKTTKLECEGLIYYGAFVDGTSWRNTADLGFVMLKYELLSPYCYTNIRSNEKKITTERIIEITNKSNADEYCYLDVEIKQLGISPINITNLTTGESIVINGMALNEEVQIVSEYKEIFSTTNPTKNMYANIVYNKHFLRMKYGKNRIKVTGNCLVYFRHQAKMYLR